jgi:hypothetical protein
MKLLNNTPDKVGYWVSFQGGGDCGSLDPGQSVDVAGWDKRDLDVEFTSSPDLEQVATFSMTIPKTKPGMAVTIGLFHQ